MKGKILTLIIGILIGAIIATGGWYIYSKSNTTDVSMPSGEQGQMGDMQPGGQGGTDENGNSDMGTPPEKPDGDNSNSTPPEKPDNE